MVAAAADRTVRRVIFIGSPGCSLPWQSHGGTASWTSRGRQETAWRHIQSIMKFCSGMDTQFLQSFVMVVDCGSVAEAARRLDLTAAAVAARGKSLEEAIGAPPGRRGRPPRKTAQARP